MVRAMSKLRMTGALVALLAPSLAAAQEGEPEQAAQPPAAEEASPADAPPTEAPEAEPQEVQAQTQPRYAPRAAPPPPIMVVVLTSGRVSDEVVSAAQQALVERLTAMAGGRPVHALGAPELRDAIGACQDDACIGQQLAQAGAQAGVIARLTGRGRRPVQIAIELRDPVSGAPRREPVTGELPIAAAEVPAAATALASQLEGAMPNPPPPPATLLVTVNVDGARVQIDGEDIGTSPVAPVEVSDGRHEVVVIARGYASVRRPATVQPGEHARLDVTVQPLEGAGPAGQGPLGEEPAGNDELITQWWFWTAIGAGVAVILGVSIGIGVAVSDSNAAAAMQDPTGIMLPPIAGGM